MLIDEEQFESRVLENWNVTSSIPPTADRSPASSHHLNLVWPR